MNRYGTRAAEYWRVFRPAEYAQIADPAAFFGRMGEQMAAQVNALALSLAGDDPTGEGYLAKVGRLRMARLQAEEQVMRETLSPSDSNDRSA